MGPNQTSKLLHSKGNHTQNKKTIYGMGKNICKCNKGVNMQNIHTAHTTKQEKKAQLNQKMGR